MLKEIRKSFSCSKKKKAKRIIVNECLIKHINIPNQINKPETKEHQAQTNSILNSKQQKANECKTMGSPIIINTQNKSSTQFKTKTKSSLNSRKDKEELLHNRDDRTIDTTQQNKLHRNSSHGTFSINKLNISSGSFYKRLKPNNKVKRKLMNDYLLSISKDFWNKDIQQQKEEFYLNYENNINMFEGWIQQIKGEGFEQNNKELNNKKKILSTLAEKVVKIRKQVVMSHKGIGDQDVKFMKYQSMIQQEKEIIETYKDERVRMSQEISELKKENQLSPSQAELIKEETQILNEQLITEKNKIGKVSIEIQQINAKISILTKDKETLQASLKVLKNQIEAYRLKITNTYQKSATFMIDVNNLVNDAGLFLR